MEQHYIVTFGISGESATAYYTTGVIIKKYPGHPGLLLGEILRSIEDDSLDSFGRLIDSKRIGIKQLTKVN